MTVQIVDLSLNDQENHLYSNDVMDVFIPPKPIAHQDFRRKRHRRHTAANFGKIITDNWLCQTSV